MRIDFEKILSISVKPFSLLFDIISGLLLGSNFKVLARNWKQLSFRKILFLPHTLSTSEQRWWMGLAALILLSGSIFFIRVYLRLTVPTPQVGGSYTEGLLQEPRTINPLFASTDADRDLARLVFSSLITYSGSGEPMLDLAESYEISQDGKTYTVSMRQNAFWHDGKPVTADDVVFTIKTIQNSQYKSPLRANWQGVEVEKNDLYSVRFTLRSPYAPFIENLSLGIIPKHLWEKINPDQAFLHELNLKPVGSGPYVFDKMRQERDGNITWYQLKRNSNFYREGPYLKKIVFYFFDTEEEMLAAWQRDRIDGFGPFPPQRLKEVPIEHTKVSPITMPRLFGIFFNEKKNTILAEKSIRQAVAFALDKARVATAVSSSGAIPIDSVLPLATAGYTSDIITYPLDLAQSAELLDKAGWKDSNGDGVRDKKSKKDLVSLKFTLSTSDWPDLMRTAAIIQEELKQAGIEINIEKHTFTELESSIIRPRNFEMLLFGQVYGYEPDPFAFWHSSQIKDPGLNIAMYSNKKADRLLEEARRSADLNARSKKYRELQKLVAQDLPAIFLYSQLYYYLLPSSIQGVNLSKISLPSDRFNEINSWYRETKRVFK